MLAFVAMVSYRCCTGGWTELPRYPEKRSSLLRPLRKFCRHIGPKPFLWLLPPSLLAVLHKCVHYSASAPHFAVALLVELAPVALAPQIPARLLSHLQ